VIGWIKCRLGRHKWVERYIPAETSSGIETAVGVVVLCQRCRMERERVMFG
jgi:hypothetical protein